jgi:hypothetical protein
MSEFYSMEVTYPRSNLREEERRRKGKGMEGREENASVSAQGGDFQAGEGQVGVCSF